MNQFNFTHILIISAAILRLAEIITAEEFIFGLAYKLRRLCGTKEHIARYYVKTFIADEEVEQVFDVPKEFSSYLQPTLLARGITCVWCVSFWLGIVFGVFYLLVPLVATAVALPFALSMFAIILQKHV